MSSDRILGSAVTIDIYSPTGGVIPFGELDAFTPEPQHDLKQWHPLGQVPMHEQPVYKDWKFTFSGGKINGDKDQIQYSIDQALLSGQAVPRFRITQTTVLYDGTTEVWIYDNAVLHNLKTDVTNAEDQIKQDMTGYAPTRVKG